MAQSSEHNAQGVDVSSSQEKEMLRQSSSPRDARLFGRAFPRGDDEDLNGRAPRNGPGGLPPDLNGDLSVLAPRHGPGGLPLEMVVWSGGAK